MDGILEKVTAFITNGEGAATRLLLFEHPTTGIQIPAGTVEEAESHSQAALREAAEESGLTGIELHKYVGFADTQLPDDRYAILHKTKVYSRPNRTSFDWAEFRRGILCTCTRRENAFLLLTYTEYDRYPDPQYVTYSITGWVPSEMVTQRQRRHYYHLVYRGDSTDSWVQFSDHHNFRPFWAPLANLPDVIEPQRVWLDYVMKELGYTFSSAKSVQSVDRLES